MVGIESVVVIIVDAADNDDEADVGADALADDEIEALAFACKNSDAFFKRFDRWMYSIFFARRVATKSSIPALIPAFSTVLLLSTRKQVRLFRSVSSGQLRSGQPGNWRRGAEREYS